VRRRRGAAARDSAAEAASRAHACMAAATGERCCLRECSRAPRVLACCLLAAARVCSQPSLGWRASSRGGFPIQVSRLRPPSVPRGLD
jgi:hypothetical protein